MFRKDGNNEIKSTAHSKYRCQYHIAVSYTHLYYAEIKIMVKTHFKVINLLN